MTQQHYVDKVGGQKTGQTQMKTERLKQTPITGEVVKDEMIPVPGTEATAAAPKLVAPVKTMKARETALLPATARISRWHFVADHGTSLADLERPDFWAGCVNKLGRRQGDSLTEITVTAEDGSFWAEMVVIDCGAQWAKCRFKYPPLVLDQTQSEIKFRGHTISFAAGEWRVSRDTDNAIIQGGFKAAQSALTWLEDHLRSMAA
jgi:hypothetical protein